MRGAMEGRLGAVALVAFCLWLTGCGTTEADTNLQGGEEVPPVTTSAEGNAKAELDGDALTVTGSFAGLSSDLQPVAGSPAHVHSAPRGQNGGIVFNLEVTSTDSRSGTFRGSKTLSDAEKEAFENGDFYVNVHTTNFPSGELRGQFEP
ncbi:MAG TPA: CHRD domain-containing protein [Myxococcus sp.]|nr:CHRD domain-containing protein [Myxococcus sp.]